MNENRNLVLCFDPNQTYPLLAQGYRVLLCTEDPLLPEIQANPNAVKLSVLLPPYEIVSMEINGDFNGMATAYMQYLANNPTAASIIYITVLSAYLGTPMVLCFGSEVRDLHFGNALLQYLQMNFGLVFSTYGTGSINTDIIPVVIANLYLLGEIDGMQALSYYPVNANIDPRMLQKLVMEMNPPIQHPGDIYESNLYFKQMIMDMHGQSTNSSGKEFYCPFQAIPEGESK